MTRLLDGDEAVAEIGPPSIRTVYADVERFPPPDVQRP